MDASSFFGRTRNNERMVWVPVMIKNRQSYNVHLMAVIITVPSANLLGESQLLLEPSIELSNKNRDWQHNDESSCYPEPLVIKRRFCFSFKSTFYVSGTWRCHGHSMVF